MRPGVLCRPGRGRPTGVGRRPSPGQRGRERERERERDREVLLDILVFNLSNEDASVEVTYYTTSNT